MRNSNSCRENRKKKQKKKKTASVVNGAESSNDAIFQLFSYTSSRPSGLNYLCPWVGTSLSTREAQQRFADPASVHRPY